MMLVKTPSAMLLILLVNDGLLFAIHGSGFTFENQIKELSN